MTPRSARLLAVPGMLIAFALSLVSTLWVQPLSFRIDPDDLGTLTDIGSHLVSAAVPVGIYLVVTRVARRRPAALRTDAQRRHFLVDASPYRAGPLAVTLGWAAGAGFPNNDDPTETGLRLSSLGAVDRFTVALVALALAGAVVALLTDRPTLALDASGLTLRTLFRRTRLGWADLVAGHPAPPADRQAGSLLVRQPAAAAGTTRPTKLRIGNLHVDPAFLAYALRDYTARPGHRDAIGTAAELNRLELAFEANPWG